LAGSLNKCTFIGNLGADPEIRALPSGGPVANFRIACGESWKDKETGEKKERTEWISVVCFNEPLCKVIEQYVHKGSKVYVEGVFRTRKYTDKDGNERYSTEIHMERFGGQLILLDKAEGGGGHQERDRQYDESQRGRYGQGQRGGSPNDTGQGRRQPARDQSRYNDMDDDIPF
jgi:single-strand DNA-binding protein